MTANPDSFKSRRTLKVGSKTYTYYSLEALQKAGLVELDKLPYAVRVMLEAVLRACGSPGVTADDVRALAAWQPVSSQRPTLSFFPGRILH